MASVLITGINGMVGSHVARRLLAEGFTVIGAAIEPACSMDVPYMQVDITNSADVDRLFAAYHFDAVVHLAALVHNNSKDLSYAAYERVNLTGSQNILGAAAAAGVGKVLFTSTIEVYGTDLAPVVGEDHARNPQTFYAVTKKLAEDYFLGLDKSAMQWGVMRFAPVYAPGFMLNLDKRIYIKPGRLAYYFKDGGYGFHFCSIANIELFIARWLQGSSSGIYNIADAAPVTARELIDFAREGNPGLRVLRLPYSLAFAGIWCLEKLMRLVGKKDSMFSVYNFRKLFQSTRWDVRAMLGVVPAQQLWDLRRTLSK